MSLLSPRHVGSAWTEYFERFNSYLSEASEGIDAGGHPAAGPAGPRPGGPVPDEHAWTLFQLLSETSRTLDRAAGPKRGLLGACRRLAHKARRARRKDLTAS